MHLEDQRQAPLLEALTQAAQRDHAPFYAPGHKRGQGTPAPLKVLLGEAVFRADLPELPELDNLFAPEGAIAQAQSLAAAAFGAEQTWFLANGSTCGIEAALLAVCRPGDKIIVPRNAHQSVVSALILTGAVPVWVQPQVDSEWDLVQGVEVSAIAQALTTHPDCRAVLLVSPTYQGVCSDVAAIAHLCHERQIPLLVDEAHGPHFAFHPDLPTPALAAGADLVVQSTHKVLSALTQASMLHVQCDRIERPRLQKALQLTQSTSPSYLLLASLDAARQQMALEGHERLTATLALAQRVRRQLAVLPGLRVFDQTALGGNFQLDLTRLTVEVSDLGLSGFAADTLLHEELGVTAELPTLRHLTFILSLGNSPADGDQLVQALTELSKRYYKALAATPAAPRVEPLAAPVVQVPDWLPRDAFFAAAEAVPAAEAIGRLSGETLCPYPPGIPLVLPGEVITAQALQSLQDIRQAGGYVTGCADSTLATLMVIKG
ncbi:MAG: aminotransferase class I/II-fold pyridoxal phosphate-dependent enzyme [Cyanobacteria bacterium Co-bin13]|nr:aminotransferase class I/II-fold pyridoxal phosphate-dependent enzyme [Cyanobacteria bacterium Co-bin13]